MNDEFIKRDVINGKKLVNPLNKKCLSSLELDEIFNSYVYEDPVSVDDEYYDDYQESFKGVFED